MAHIPYACNILSAAFPFLSSSTNFTTIIRQLDDIYNRANDSSQLLIPDQSIPQCLFLENVMPTGRGYQAVLPYQFSNPIPTFTQFTENDRVYTFRAAGYSLAPKPPGPDIVESYDYPVTLRFYYDSAAGGFIRVFRLQPTGGSNPNYVWVNIQTINDLSMLPTMATVNGITFFTFNNTDFTYRWDVVGEQLVPVTLNGLSSSFVGITAANGYLIAWALDNTVAWSAVTDPTDFVPSLITGAGSGVVQDVQGLITFCLPINGGFIIYSGMNVVSATFTNNLRFPFTFKGLSGSGGCTSIVQVGYNPAGAEHYYFGTNGLQVVDLRVCKNLYAELNDFLSGRTIEEYSFSQHQPIEVSFNNGLRKRIQIVSGRYVVFSYGDSNNLECSQAIILDLTLGRFGKIRIPHLAVFDFLYTSDNEAEDNRISIAVTERDGTVFVIDFRPYLETNGVIILGKYQLSGDELSQITEVVMQNIFTGAPIRCYDAITLDGESVESITPFYENSRIRRAYNGYGSTHGYNHQIIFEGAFDMTSLRILLNNVGRL